MSSEMEQDLCERLEALIDGAPGVRRADVAEQAYTVKTHTGHFGKRALGLLERAGLGHIVHSDFKDGEWTGDPVDQAAEITSK